jgi:hypothetical protein
MILSTKQHNILCLKARQLMHAQKKDTMHDINHIDRTLEIAKQISKNVIHVDADLVEQVVLWHDVSRARNGRGGIFMYLFDDILSVRIVKKQFNKMKIPKKFTHKVCSLILENRKYGKKTTKEGAIFKDADMLDIYSIERYDIAKNIVEEKLKKYPIAYKPFNFIINLHIYLAIKFVHNYIYNKITFEESKRIYFEKMFELEKYFQKNRANVFNKRINRHLAQLFHMELQKGKRLGFA